MSYCGNDECVEDAMAGSLFCSECARPTSTAPTATATEQTKITTKEASKAKANTTGAMEEFFGCGLQLQQAEGVGRFVTTTQRVEKGATILLARPWLSMGRKSNRKRTCAYCARTSARLTHGCKLCECVYYCNARCLEFGSALHAVECKYAKKLKNKDDSLLTLLRIWLLRSNASLSACPWRIPGSHQPTTTTTTTTITTKTTTDVGMVTIQNTVATVAAGVVVAVPAVVSAAAVAALSPVGPPTAASTSTDSAMEQLLATLVVTPVAMGEERDEKEVIEEEGEVQELFDLDLVPAPGFAAFHALCSHELSWAKEKVQLWAKPLRVLLALIKQMPYELSPLNTCMPAPSTAELMSWLSRIESNAFSTEHNGKETGDQVMPYAAMFNHSCRPNAEMMALNDDDDVDLGGASRVVALTDIEVGDEILISYIPFNLPRTTRQSILQNKFHFKCACPRCCEELGKPVKHVFEKSRNKAKKRPPKKKREDAKYTY